MKRQLMFGTMLSAALAVGVGAQQPPAAGGRIDRPRRRRANARRSRAVDDPDGLSAGGE